MEHAVADMYILFNKCIYLVVFETVSEDLDLNQIRKTGEDQ